MWRETWAGPNDLGFWMVEVNKAFLWDNSLKLLNIFLICLMPITLDEEEPPTATEIYVFEGLLKFSIEFLHAIQSWELITEGLGDSWEGQGQLLNEIMSFDQARMTHDVILWRKD